MQSIYYYNEMELNNTNTENIQEAIQVMVVIDNVSEVSTTDDYVSITETIHVNQNQNQNQNQNEIIIYDREHKYCKICIVCFSIFACVFALIGYTI
jgi:formamidopyrimidine-DNA glycosylase